MCSVDANSFPFSLSQFLPPPPHAVLGTSDSSSFKTPTPSPHPRTIFQSVGARFTWFQIRLKHFKLPANQLGNTFMSPMPLKLKNESQSIFVGVLALGQREV